MLVEQLATLLIKVGAVVRPMEIGGEAKVRDGNVAARVEEEVVGLDLSRASKTLGQLRVAFKQVGRAAHVSVNGAEHPVRLADCQNHLGDVEPCHILGEGIAIDE